MGKARLEFDYAAFGELRNDKEVNAALRRLAQGIADRANSAAGLSDGYRIHDVSNGSRARYVVNTYTRDAQKAEARDRCLTRALEAEE